MGHAARMQRRGSVACRNGARKCGLGLFMTPTPITDASVSSDPRPALRQKARPHCGRWHPPAVTISARAVAATTPPTGHAHAYKHPCCPRPHAEFPRARARVLRSMLANSAPSTGGQGGQLMMQTCVDACWVHESTPKNWEESH